MKRMNLSMADFSFKSYMPAAISALTEGTEDGIIKIANKLVNQAKANANFKKGYQTGQTRAGIMYRTSKDDGGFEPKGETKLSTRAGKNEAIVGVNNNHALYLEFGTRHMDSQPFLRPAFDVVTRGKNANVAMQNALNNSFKRKLKS